MPGLDLLGERHAHATGIFDFFFFGKEEEGGGLLEEQQRLALGSRAKLLRLSVREQQHFLLMLGREGGGCIALTFILWPLLHNVNDVGF